MLVVSLLWIILNAAVHLSNADDIVCCGTNPMIRSSADKGECAITTTVLPETCALYNTLCSDGRPPKLNVCCGIMSCRRRLAESESTTGEPTSEPTIEPTTEPTTEPTIAVETTNLLTVEPSTVRSLPSLFATLSVPFFWFFAIYSASVFIIALLHFFHDTCPHLAATKTIDPKTKASCKDICSQSIKYSTLNGQQHVMDMVDIITDIMYSLNAYFLLYSPYHTVCIIMFATTGLLITLLAIKWILLRHHALINNKIWYDMVMYDLFTASLCNAVQGGIAFYILYEQQTEWDVIMYIKVGVVGYQMTVKLFRAVLFCMCDKKQQYEQQYIHARLSVVQEPKKVISASASGELEQQLVVQTPIEVEIESKDSKDQPEVEVESKEVEIELMIAEDKESDGVRNLDEEAMQLVIDINNYGKLDETRALLTDLSKNSVLSDRYEQEWVKNVMGLISENQNKLRNQSMKPVVKDYVKTLQKDGNEEDKERFMMLLQNANNTESVQS
eukprot:82323_1